MNTLYTKEGENPSLGQKFVDNEKTISNNVTIVTKNITLKGLIIIQSARLPAFVLFLSNTYTKSYLPWSLILMFIVVDNHGKES